MTLEPILYGLCALDLFILAVADFKTYEIPLGCNLFIGVLGVVRLLSDLPCWYHYVAGFFAVSSLFWAVYIVTGSKGIGGGDVKLMAAAGLFLGWKKILLALALGSVSALVIHAALMALKKKGRTLAFGPYLAVGIFCAMLWGNTWWAVL